MGIFEVPLLIIAWAFAIAVGGTLAVLLVSILWIIPEAYRSARAEMIEERERKQNKGERITYDLTNHKEKR